MYNKVLQMQKELNATVVILDIDGTLKDLCKEHENALKKTLKELEVSKLSKNIVLFVNNVAMSIVKAGMFSTNNNKQEILTCVYSLISFKNYTKFRKSYYANYKKELCLFDGVEKLLTSLKGKARVYFATVNEQNYNLKECGIEPENIVCKPNSKKLTTYLKLFAGYDFRSERTLIVGDNFFDDILSAKRFKVHSLMVDHYDSKLKKILCKLLKISIC